MSDYTGKICPFCKTGFEENDEIIVCSSCDMPHHKDCWIENQGCTTFGCMGTIRAADGSATTVTATEISFDDPQAASHIFCTRCGAKNSVTYAFCGQCGNPMSTTSAAPVPRQQNPVNTTPNVYAQQNVVPQPAPNTFYQQNNYYNQGNTYGQQSYYAQSNVIDADVASLVGTNRDYYISKFQQMKAENKKTSWNWMAFLFPPYWFVYRKMYGYGLAALGVALLISWINVPVFSVISLGLYVAAGFFANYIYMQWVEKNANQAKAMSEPFKTQFIQKNGDVNLTALTIAIVGWLLLAALLYAF